MNKKKRYKIFVGNLPNCCGDEKMLKQVWINLLGNAIKYSAKKINPTIEAGFEKEDRMTVYFVRDKGAGFDMAYSNKLFQPFQRLHSENEFEGTGVGLAFVKRVEKK